MFDLADIVHDAVTSAANALGGEVGITAVFSRNGQDLASASVVKLPQDATPLFGGESVDTDAVMATVTLPTRAWTAGGDPKVGDNMLDENGQRWRISSVTRKVGFYRLEVRQT